MDEIFFLEFPLNRVFVLLIAFVLDIIFGDPQKIMHPVILIGKAINYFESRLLKNRYKRFKGLLLVVLVSIIFTGSVFLLTYYFLKLNLLLGCMVSALILHFFICNRSMVSHFNSIFKKIATKDIEGARIEVSKVVSRSTGRMGYKDLIRSSVESIAENTSDGLIAPLFYYLLGGVPLVVFYKVISTLDSMVGYKNERYYDFGFYPAKFDDFLNYIPSRLTAGIVSSLSFLVGGNLRNSVRVVKKYSRKHKSPNSGYPESAFAGALGLQFGGPAFYFNQEIFSPFIGDRKKEFEPGDIRRALRLSIFSSLFFMAIIITIYIGLYYLTEGAV